VVLITALNHGLTEARRRQLIEELDVPLQTLWRVQPIRLRFQQVEVLPWELSVHPGSYNRLMGG
jgi:hypothetical protein